MTMNLPEKPIAKAPTTLTWLHLSDLQFRRDKPYDKNTICHTLLQDIQACIHEQSLCPDFIAVSGDIAFEGLPEEYKTASQFFDDLLVTTGLPKDRLFPVPGNHDVNRQLISTLTRSMGTFSTRASVYEILADERTRGAMLARLGNYTDFVCDYFDGYSFDESRYFYARAINVGGRQIALLGLNSAWLAYGGEEDRGYLAIGEPQAKDALKTATDADLKIAIIHHPFSYLCDFERDDSASMLADGCNFILHGHMHQVGLLQHRGPDTNAFIIGTGTCRETHIRPNSYNFVHLNLDDGLGWLYLRMYEDRRGGFWIKDTLSYRNVPDGVYPFSFDSRPVSP